MGLVFGSAGILARRRFLSRAGRYRPPGADRNGIVVLPPAPNPPAGKHGGRNLENSAAAQGGLTQERTLKPQLKIRRGTLAARENDLQVSQGLEQRIGVSARRRRASSCQPRAQRVQISQQSPPQPIYRFQSEGQPQFLGGGFERKARQHFDQPSPHQRSGQGVTRQNISQDEGKRLSATAAPAAIGTKHPLAPDQLAAGLGGIVAPQNAVPV